MVRTRVSPQGSMVIPPRLIANILPPVHPEDLAVSLLASLNNAPE